MKKEIQSECQWGVIDVGARRELEIIGITYYGSR